MLSSTEAVISLGPMRSPKIPVKPVQPKILQKHHTSGLVFGNITVTAVIQKAVNKYRLLSLVSLCAF